MPRGELGKRGQKQNLQDFGNDYGIHRNRVNAPINVDESFDNPLAVNPSHGEGKGLIFCANHLAGANQISPALAVNCALRDDLT